MSEITRCVIGMPFDMAMESEISRRQFHAIARELLAENNRLKADLDSYKQGAQVEADAGDEARAEVRQLKAENERLERNRDMWKAQVEQQAEELTALRKDAERYRFLRSDLTMGGDVDFCIVRKHWKAPALESILSLTNADEQIDAAMTR